MWRWLMILGLLLGPARLGAWTPEHWFDRARSPRIANYKIQAALDWQQKTLAGEETITWRNTGSAPTGELPLHLYLNAFKGPQTLFYLERGGAADWDAGDARHWGYCRLLSVHLDNRPLEGHFGEDETVWWVRLPRTVAPGETIRLEVAWASRFPLVRERSGWSRDFLMGAQWFPQAGVYEGDHWNCHAYHTGTGFFADFGTYDVDLSLPGNLLLAHTGTLANPRTPEDFTPEELAGDPGRPANVLWKLHAEDVHDFAWAAMPKGRWGRRAFDYRGVRVACFFQPADAGSFDREQAAVKAALKHAGEWFFPYPYPVLTFVDVPEGAAGLDRTEYPTLVTAASRPFDPLQRRTRPEQAAIHEVGHQWFYGMLAANAAEEPWLDEGLTTWFTQKAMERAYQNLFSSRRFQVGTDTPGSIGYWRDPSVDPLARPGHQARDLASSITAARYKAPLVLDQLEAMVGRPMMERVVQEYARQMAFRHPTGRDFQRIAEQVTGRSLAGFWRDFVAGTDILDVVIQKVGTQEVLEGGWMESPAGPVFAAPQPASPGRRGSVTLLRKGGLQLPITLWVRLENRTEQRLTWDGQDRWVTYGFDSPVTMAILDPDGNYPLLKDRLHASYALKPARRGLHYWAQMAWGAITGLLQAAGLG
jgi:hypothetical protein